MIDRSIGLGYVRGSEAASADYVQSGTYELEVATKRVPADVSLKPLYDPGMRRIKI